MASSTLSVGLRSSSRSSRNEWKSAWFSCGRMISPAEQRPWESALRQARDLPWGVRGPVDLRALARFARSFAGEMDAGDAVVVMRPPWLERRVLYGFCLLYVKLNKLM